MCRVDEHTVMRQLLRCFRKEGCLITEKEKVGEHGATVMASFKPSCETHIISTSKAFLSELMKASTNIQLCGTGAAGKRQLYETEPERLMEIVGEAGDSHWPWILIKVCSCQFF